MILIVTPEWGNFIHDEGGATVNLRERTPRSVAMPYHGAGEMSVGLRCHVNQLREAKLRDGELRTN
tara:strand:+ start:1431 stop:1628 length:198 start_codon:yes stop_codon:yes gene_type:complete